MQSIQNNVTVVLDKETVKMINSLATLRNKSFDEMVIAIVDHGTKDICYRMKRNQQKWQEQKQLKATVEALQARISEMGGE